MKGRIVKNSLLYLIVNNLHGLVQILMLPLYTRYIPLTEYGLLSLANVFASIFVMIGGLQVSSGMAVHYFEYDPEERIKYVSTLLFSKIIILAVFISIYKIFDAQIIGITFPSVVSSGLKYFFLTIMGIYAMDVANVCKLLLKIKENASILLYVTAIFNLLGIGLDIYFLVIMRFGLEGLLWGRVINGIVHLIILLFFIRKSLSFNFSLPMLKKNLSFSIPLIPHQLGTLIFALSDRIVLERFVPISAIGLYSLGDRISSSLKNIIISVDDAILPNFMRLAKKDKKEAAEVFKEYITGFVVMVLAVFAGVSIFSEELVRLLADIKYLEAYKFVPVLIAAYVFRGVYRFPVRALMSEKKTWYIAFISLFSGGMNILLNILLIPRFGAIAAAWTTLVSNLLTLVMAYHFSNRFFPLIYEWRKIFLMCASSFLLVTLTNYFHVILGSVNILLLVFAKSIVMLLIILLLIRISGTDVRKLYMKTKEKMHRKVSS